MPFIAQSCIDNIRQRVSIVDVVTPYVQLKPSGHYLKGLSPFSHEKTPSFFVDPQRNIFKCFSSGYAGDVFRFLELKEQLTFTESVEFLCERFNIPIEYKNGDTTKNNTLPLKRLLFSVYEKAAVFFEQQFWLDNPLAKQVRAYWENERHFKADTAREFHVGFAPTDLAALYNFLAKSGFDRAVLEQSGLFYKPKTFTKHLIARYQGRLILPICDIQGRVIAFSGRQLPFIDLPNDPTREAKYVNSPETPIFVKGHELFNLSRARQALDKGSSFYLVEGPLDVIRCWECGLKTTVAPQGTGLTEDQLRLLKRYNVPIVGMFDGDSAGIKAGVRLMSLGIPLELDLTYCLLSKDEDPDSAFFKNPDYCASLLQSAVQPVEFFVKIFKALGYDDAKVQQNVLQQMLPIIAKCESSVMRFEFLRTLGQTFFIPMQVLEEELYRVGNSRPMERVETPVETVSKNRDFGTSLEDQILLFLFHAPKLTELILKHLSLDWIKSETLSGQLLLKILSEFQENGIEPLERNVICGLSEEEENLWGQLLAEEFSEEGLLARLSEVLQQMYRRYLKKMISDIDKKLIKGSNLNTELFKKLQMDRFSYKRALASVSSTICLTEQGK